MAARVSRAAELRQQLAAVRLHPDDLASVSDRLLAAVIAAGDEETVLRRVDEHRAAGADHVCIQVLTADPTEFPQAQWRRLAAAMR